MTRKRTKHTAAFKAKVALEALRDRETIAELSRRYKVHANQIYKWRRKLLEDATRVFEAAEGIASETTGREGELLQKIGELTMERDFLSRGLARYR